MSKTPVSSDDKKKLIQKRKVSEESHNSSKPHSAAAQMQIDHKMLHRSVGNEAIGQLLQPVVEPQTPQAGQVQPRPGEAVGIQDILQRQPTAKDQYQDAEVSLYATGSDRSTPTIQKAPSQDTLDDNGLADTSPQTQTVYHQKVGLEQAKNAKGNFDANKENVETVLQGPASQEEVIAANEAAGSQAVIAETQNTLGQAQDFLKNAKEKKPEEMSSLYPETLSDKLHGLFSKLKSYIENIKVPSLVERFSPLISPIMEAIKHAKNAYKANKDRKAFKGATLEKGNDVVSEVAIYAQQKVTRRLVEETARAILSGFKAVATVITILSGGLAAAVQSIVQFAKTLVESGLTLYHNVKGAFKFLSGTKGKGRAEATEKLMLAAKKGDQRAVDLITELTKDSKVDLGANPDLLSDAKQSDALRELLTQKMASMEGAETPGDVQGMKEVEEF